MLKLRVLYCTSGVTGSGRIIRGISIRNAFERSPLDYEFCILSRSPFSWLAEREGIDHVELPYETPLSLSFDSYKNSKLYDLLKRINPDVIIIDLFWQPFHHIFSESWGKKVFIARQVDDVFFQFTNDDEKMEFDPSVYDLVLKIEPFTSIFRMTEINPLIIRNKEEIFTKKDARELLNLDVNTPACLLSLNAHPGDFERAKKIYSYMEDEGYQMIYSSNYNEGFFPVVDYFNAFDMIICGAGYNSFWEAKFFEKDTIFLPATAMFETGERRIRECSDYQFYENGADQLVRMVMNL